MVAAGQAGLVVYQNTGGVDAIDAYSRRLVDALVARGTAADYIPDGLAAARRCGTDPAWILLEYNPFSYARWGVSPGLLRDAAAIGRRASGRFAVCVHEPWTHVHDWRSALMAGCQRAQLPALLRPADVVFGTTQPLVQRLGRDAVHAPVGSNVTPLGLSRHAARDRLGIAQGLVVALFGTGHPSRALDHAEAALAALAAERGADALLVLNLGLGAPPLNIPAGVAVQAPAHLEPAELSLRLHASDVMLLPFVDGVSTRRTTLMAALAHGLPVVSVRGTETDRVLFEHPEALVLTPARAPTGYARAVVELAADPGRLQATGSAGRHLYKQEFDWPVLAERVVSALQREP